MSQQITRSNTSRSIAPHYFALPVRQTPKWDAVNTFNLDYRHTLEKVITGRLPVGIVPHDLISEKERLYVVNELRNRPMRQYDNTGETEKVAVHGITFVDSPSLSEYLAAGNDEAFEELTTPLLHRVINTFADYGFDVKPLTDPVTLLPYHAKVCRQINVPGNCYTEAGNQCTVLHCDDLLRDGNLKKDFRIPTVLEDMHYHQFSVCIQLEDGGYRPDDIIVYEKQYSRELEPGFYGDGGWRYDAARLAGCRKHAYTPELRKCYMFSTLNFHDVRGGHPRSVRINFSVFFIYVPGTNTLYYYN